MESPHTGPFNIGNPREFTMLELAQHVKEVVNPHAQIVFRENTADDPSRRKPDTSKARTELGWEPQVELREGLQLMVDDFRARILGEDIPTPSHGRKRPQYSRPDECVIAGKKLKIGPPSARMQHHHHGH